ncbi:hypothetical protein Q8A67_024152 [Cirrhinus molitorella]|uniref:Uncharacterized protein n=1 Tax=Cirrhinus molitorella TaxID=172907 RepID=A0AA88P1F8_9TELE|nr:hypothetical protein Q8A67_024152 [Cirrhinus molitorella]
MIFNPRESDGLHEIWGWREAVGQAVWAARYLKPESTLPPCVSFIGDYGENLQVMRIPDTFPLSFSTLLADCDSPLRGVSEGPLRWKAVSILAVEIGWLFLWVSISKTSMSLGSSHDLKIQQRDPDP